MKYTSEQINAMSWREWAETMAKELNEAGFQYRGIGNKLEPYSVGKAEDGPKLFLLGSVENSEEITYLKNIGLLNNGRCPMCGNKIIGASGRFTSGFDSNYHFQVCQSCVNKRKRVSINSSNQGCIVALLLMPLSIVNIFFKFKSIF